MDRFLASDGLSLAYKKAGRADGRGAILLHGLTGNSDLWGQTASALAPRFRVIGLDLRGHGESGRTTEADDFTFERAALDVIELANAVGFERFSLFGHGLGGDIAQLVALDHADRLEVLVLVGCGGRPLDPRSGWALTRAQIAQVVSERGIEGGWEAYLDAGLLGYALDEVPEEILDLWREQFVKTAPAAFIGFAMASADQQDRTGRLEALEVPTLVSVGDDDAAFYEQAQELAAAIPSGELVVVPGGGHSPQISRGEEFNEIVLEFLKRALPRARA